MRSELGLGGSGGAQLRPECSVLGSQKTSRSSSREDTHREMGGGREGGEDSEFFLQALTRTFKTSGLRHTAFKFSKMERS